MIERKTSERWIRTSRGSRPKDAVVSRALKALHSPHDHLKEDAIGSFADIPNPEVT